MKFSVVISQTSLVVISQTITLVFSQTSQAIFSQIFTFKKFFQCSAPEVSAPLLPAAHAADVTGARAAVRSAAPPPQASRKRSSFLPLQGRGLTGEMGHLRQSGELPGCRCKQDYHPFLSDSPAHANDLFDVRQNRGICFAAAHSAVKALSPAPGGVPYRQGISRLTVCMAAGRPHISAFSGVDARPDPFRTALSLPAVPACCRAEGASFGNPVFAVMGRMPAQKRTLGLR